MTTAWTCASNVFWMRTIDGNRVVYARTSFLYRDRNVWTCTCSHNKPNPGCEHIEQAKKQRCGWNAELDPARQPEEVRQVQDDRTSVLVHRCPECHGDAQAVEVGV